MIGINRRVTDQLIPMVLIALIAWAGIIWSAPVKCSQDEALTWISERRAEEWAKDYDGIGESGTPQCVDLIEYYFDYLIGYHYIGNASRYESLILPKGWTYVDTPQPGDIAVWGKTEHKKYGHVAIVEHVWACKMFSFIEIDGATGEFNRGGLFTEDPTIYIRPDWDSYIVRS